jgi:D-alanyl-D-alanine carboxypeptidase/D-alanyl-D-alanine-endopeptidase (penicillin-binding protein 4)
VFLQDGAGGRAEVVVNGTIAAGSAPYRTWIHLGPPGLAVSNALTELLREAGIEVGGRARTGRAPAGAVLLLEHESPGLGEIVAGVNKPSSNFGAEMLTRALDAYTGGPPGSTAGGTRRIAACLADWAVPADGLVLADGSGYGRENRLTAEALVGVLLAARRDPAWRAEFEASLARAGEDGSLRNRLSDLRGRVRAKTGTLNGVSALAGYAVDRQGREIAFAILVNGPGAGPDDVDRVLRSLLAASDALPRRAGKAS